MNRHAFLSSLVLFTLLASGANAACHDAFRSTEMTLTTPNTSSREHKITSRGIQGNPRWCDLDDARNAVRHGKLVPLGSILQIADRRAKGTVLKAGLDIDDGMLVYQIEMLLAETGRKVEMWIDARNGDLMRIDY